MQATFHPKGMHMQPVDRRQFLGFKGAPNPDAEGTLPKAIAAVNALDPQPDFIVFTGDLTHTTDDPAERRRRMAQFKEMIGGLKTQRIRLLAGEHDASLDNGASK